MCLKVTCIVVACRTFIHVASKKVSEKPAVARL